MLNVIKPSYGSTWSTSHCGKKVKRFLVFKLMQQHINNWDVDKLLNPFTSMPLGYGQIYSIFCGHKCFNVTVGNYTCCFCIYFVVMYVAFLGERRPWVQCKHLHHILQNIMYYGKFEEFIHYLELGRGLVVIGMC
jgi:hypothetical protein